MLVNIQVLRAFAALAVVVYHTVVLLPGGVHTEFDGVVVFFVISGFLMTKITRRSAEWFMFDRLARIVPIYWILTLSCFVWFGSGIGNPLHSLDLARLVLQGDRDALLVPFADLYTYATPMHLEVLLRSLLFIPTTSPVIGSSWSLDLEAFYYLLFWAALCVNRKWAPLLVAVVLLALRPWGHIDGVAALYLNEPGVGGAGSHYNQFFVIGIALYYVTEWLRPRVAVGRYAVLLGSACLFLAYAYIYGAGHKELQGHALVAALVLSVLLLEMHGWQWRWRPILLLGDASYVLYLIHELVIETLRPVLEAHPSLPRLSSAAGTLIVVVLSIAVAIAVHLWVERPILGALKALKRRWQAAQAVQAEGALP